MNLAVPRQHFLVTDVHGMHIGTDRDRILCPRRPQRRRGSDWSCVSYHLECNVIDMLTYAPCAQIPARFGLLDDSPERWKTFQARIASLNSAAAPGTAYKVFFFSRHGEGVRECSCIRPDSSCQAHYCLLSEDNVGERKYGTTV